MPLVYIGLLLFSFSIYSQESKEIQADKIVVIEGKKNQESQANQKFISGSNVEIDLESSKNRYTSLPEILEREAGLRVRSFGGLGSYSTLSIRGTNPNQSRYYVDGIPFTNAQSGEVNLADLPFDNLEAIEVYKSGVPFGLTGSSIGGALNLRTMKPLKNSTRVNLGGGSYNTGKLSISHSNTNQDKDFGYTLFALTEKSDQNYSFLNDKGTILLNTLDDTIDRRKNAWFERAQGSGSFFWDWKGTEIKLFTDVNHRRLGIPGPGNNQTEKTQRKYTKYTAGLSTNTKEFLFEQLQLETRTYLTTFEDTFFDPRSEFSSGRTNANTNSDTKGFQLSPTIYLLDYYQILRFSMNAEKEDFRRDRRNSNHVKLESEPIRNRRHGNFQVEDEIQLFQKRFFLIPSFSYDDYQDVFEDNGRYTNKTTKLFNPRLGLLWNIYQISDTKFGLKGNANRASRVASFLELFGERGQILGNSNLRPEISLNKEIGIFLHTQFYKISSKSELTWFRKNIQDMILFVPNSQFSLRAENVDRAIINGFEFSQILDWKDWKGKLNYTYSIAKNDSESPALRGKYLPLRPVNEVYSSLQYKLYDFDIGADFTYIGAVFRDRTNEYVNFLPGRDLYGAFISYSFNKKETGEDWKLGLDVRNITDKKFSDLIGYPLPGRIWYLNLSMRF